VCASVEASFGLSARFDFAHDVSPRDQQVVYDVFEVSRQLLFRHSRRVCGFEGADDIGKDMSRDVGISLWPQRRVDDLRAAARSRQREYPLVGDECCGVGLLFHGNALSAKVVLALRLGACYLAASKLRSR
jgi:hypothetical protein